MCVLKTVFLESYFVSDVSGYFLEEKEDKIYYLPPFSYEYLKKYDLLSKFSTLCANTFDTDLIHRQSIVEDKTINLNALQQAVLSRDNHSYSDEKHINFIRLCEYLFTEIEIGNVPLKMEYAYNLGFYSFGFEKEELDNFFVFLFEKIMDIYKILRMDILNDCPLYESLLFKKNK